jgi:hypothetical protein
MRAALVRGITRREIAAGVDLELLLDMLTAPYYFRALFGHRPITAGMNARVVEYALRAAAPI